MHTTLNRSSRVRLFTTEETASAEPGFKCTSNIKREATNRNNYPAVSQHHRTNCSVFTNEVSMHLLDPCSMPQLSSKCVHPQKQRLWPALDEKGARWVFYFINTNNTVD